MEGRRVDGAGKNCPCYISCHGYDKAFWMASHGVGLIQRLAREVVLPGAMHCIMQTTHMFAGYFVESLARKGQCHTQPAETKASKSHFASAPNVMKSLPWQILHPSLGICFCKPLILPPAKVEGERSSGRAMGKGRRNMQRGWGVEE